MLARTREARGKAALQHRSLRFELARRSPLTATEVPG